MSDGISSSAVGLLVDLLDVLTYETPGRNAAELSIDELDAVQELTEALENEAEGALVFPHSWEAAVAVVMSLRGRDPALSQHQLTVVARKVAQIRAKMECSLPPVLCQVGFHP